MRLELSSHGFHKSRLPRCLWSTRGYTCLLVPGHDPPQDIAIFKDVSLNPGPDLNGSWIQLDRFTTSQVVGCHSHTNSPSLTIKYSRKFLLGLRSSACTPCPQVLGKLKLHGVLKYGGGKGGKKTRGNVKSIKNKTMTVKDFVVD